MKASNGIMECVWSQQICRCIKFKFITHLSASSKTKYLTLLKSAFLISKRSLILPGVATTQSTPRWSWAICGYLGAPPYKHTELQPRGVPYFLVSSIIWTASSRVGARTSSTGLRNPRLGGPLCRCWWRDGRRNPHVFPLPVFAMQIMSSPRRAIGHAYKRIYNEKPCDKFNFKKNILI